MRQEELRTATFNYRSSQAVQRQYNPQGFFGLLVADLDRDKHFVSVGLDHPFFQRVKVEVDAPIDFAAIGLRSADVAFDYPPQRPRSQNHYELSFASQTTEPRAYDVPMSDGLDMAARHQVQYHFDPASGWEGESFSYDLPAKVSEDRTLHLNPFEDLGFLEIPLVPDRIDWGIVDFIQVHLDYQSPSGWRAEKSFTVTESSGQQSWKLRLSDPEARTYRKRFVVHLKNGDVRETEWKETRESGVLVNDPFEGALEITFIPLFDSGQVKKVYIDVEYGDDDNDYERSERLQLAGSASDDVNLRIAVLDEEKKQYRYRFTFVTTTNQLQRGAWVETEETLIPVAPAE